MAPEQPTLLAMHHPPLVTGIPAWHEYGLRAADRRALGEVLARHGQVRRLGGGHVHRMIAAEFAGRSLLTVPSTYVQARLDFGAQESEWGAEPAGFALHGVLDGELVLYVLPVG